MISDVILIGAGGTGSILAPQLARFVAHNKNFIKYPSFVVCDGDKLEADNLSRQAYEKTRLNQYKSEALVKQIVELELPVRTAFVSDYFGSQSDFFANVADQPCPVYDEDVLVISAVDNDATNKLIYDQLSNTDPALRWLFIFCGNNDYPQEVDPAQAEIQGNVVWTNRGMFSQEVDPFNVYPQLITPIDVPPRKGGCMEKQKSNPQIITANFLSASYTMAVLQNILDGRISSSHHCLKWDSRLGISRYI